MKTRLVPFDADKYTPDRKVVTRKGIEPLEILISKYMAYSVIAVFPKGIAVIFLKNGMTSKDPTVITDEDLFFAEEVEIKTFYVNVYSGGIEPYAYKNREEALETVRKDNDFYKGVLKIAYSDEDLIK
jgi:hypothetical protein